MENFIVSARKYRPATFASVVGQKHITSTLKNAIERGQLAHAYLFCGPRGVGKTTCARIFAKAINCLAPDGAEACNECESCRSFNEGRSLNIHELDAASNNSVDDIRNLIEQVRILPQGGRYSVFIIDEVHMLSAAAFTIWTALLGRFPVGRVSLFGFLIPVFGAVFSALVLGENIMTVRNLLSLLLVSGGIALANSAAASSKS